MAGNWKASRTGRSRCRTDGCRRRPLDATGHAHHDQSQLFQIVKEGMASANGGRPTDMPALEGVLSDAEISAVLAFIRSHW